MPNTNLTTPKPAPTGTKTVRLADVPLTKRLAAIHHLMRTNGLTIEDTQDLLVIALDPGDAGGRIAA